MSFLVIRKEGVFRTAIRGGRVADLRDHIANGYPKLLPDFEAGKITGEEVEVLPVVPQSEVDARTAQLTLEHQEEAAAREQQEIVGNLLTAFLNHENRIRALEGQPPVTRAQLVARVRTL